MLKKLFLVSIASFFTACQEENQDAWVAKYQDDIITTTEVQSVMPKEMSADDSLQFVNRYVENWVKDKMLLQEKDNFLNEEELAKIESQVAQYREDLIEVLIEEKLMRGFSNDVSEDELQKYYNDFPDTFILKNDILSYRLMEIPEDSARNYKKLLQNEDYDDLELRLKTNNYYYDFKKNNWIEKDKLLAADIIPEKIKKSNLLSKNQIFTNTENGKTFMLNIIDVGKNGEKAPFEYIKPTIKNVVLNKRKLNLLSQKKNELYEKALENDEIKRK